MFSCIVAKRAGFEDLVIKSRLKLKCHQHAHQASPDDEFPIQFFLTIHAFTVKITYYYFFNDVETMLN